MDYKYLGKCQFDLANPERECDEPAIAKVWWDAEENDSMLVCAYHLEVLEDAGNEHLTN